MSYSPKRVLVTGGAGFIGSAFIKLALSHTNQIERLINLDCLTYAANLKNLSECDRDPRYQLIEASICQRDMVYDILIKEKIDTVVHFAAESHVDRSIDSATPFIETNIVGTFTLLDVAKTLWLDKLKLDATQCRFHHISTDEVYGSLTASDLAFTETTPYDPRSPYSASKASSDHLVRAYYHTHGLPVTLSNCSNNYGPGQHSEKLIPTIIRACAEQSPIPVYGDGSNIRDWLYVDDHVDAILNILSFGAVGETYNIGGNNEKSNLDIVKFICRLMDERYPQNPPHHQLISFVEDRLGHDWRYAINQDKISKQLGWHPRTGFIDGIKQTIEFYLG